MRKRVREKVDSVTNHLHDKSIPKVAVLLVMAMKMIGVDFVEDSRLTVVFVVVLELLLFLFSS
jgi:hypothetical protein